MSFAPGPHTFYATYDGNATHPPGTSNVVTQVFRKTQPVITVSLPFAVRPGAAAMARIDLRANPFGPVPGGNVSLYEGSTLLGTIFADNHCCSGGMTVEIPIPALPSGTHYLYASYEGSANFEPGKSALVKLTVYSAGAFALDVTSTTNTINANGDYPTLNSRFDIYRRIGSGAWTKIASRALYASWSEAGTPGVVYTYRMEAFDPGGQLLATSNTDLAMVKTFTDDPLTLFTTVKAVHIQELLDATNILRTAAGLAPLSLPDAGAGQTIRASHILALRTAINEARVALGAAPVTFSTTVTAGSIMHVQDIQDLREAMR
jgi:hypothetical protein